jgi:hypothetical protein
MPPALKLAEDKYQEGIKKLLELKKSSTLQQENTEKLTAEVNKGS